MWPGTTASHFDTIQYAILYHSYKTKYICKWVKLVEVALHSFLKSTSKNLQHLWMKVWEINILTVLN